MLIWVLKLILAFNMMKYSMSEKYTWSLKIMSDTLMNLDSKIA